MDRFDPGGQPKGLGAPRIARPLDGGDLVRGLVHQQSDRFGPGVVVICSTPTTSTRRARPASIVLSA